jgi:arginyl-tRNA synthetase
MRELIVKLLKKHVPVDENLLEVPPSSELGDFAFPCFSLAKTEKKSPLLIAENLAEKLRKELPKEISNVGAKAGYVNFFVDKKFLAEKTLKEVFKPNFGEGSEKGKIMIEFSQPNTHKAFHVGHIRGTSIGESLARISESLGKKVIRANYSGDTGMHIAKWIWCYQKYHSKDKLQDDEGWIASIYVDAVKRLAENEDFQKGVDEINRKIETKEDKKINELWKKTRQLSIKSWDRIYKELNTFFDIHFFESEVEIPGKRLVEELLSKGIAKKSEDAVIMDFKEQNMGVWVLLRRDGTVLYSAKDLALAARKVKEFPADDYLVIVGDEQRLHFEQLKKTLEIMDYKKFKDYNFLTFGMVRLPTGKMSSRTGENVLYSDFMKEILDYSVEEIKKRHNDLNEREIGRRALAISVSAIKYSMLKQDPNRVIIFDKKEALDFDGNTGPYLLYSYARANSIIKKVKNKRCAVKIIDIKQQEVDLIKKLSSFPGVVKQAYKNLAPNLIANYTYELAQQFNEFYHACPVLGSPEECFRLKLVEAFKIVMKKSFNLLGIEEVEEM